jgi:hypothetical protein
VFCSLFKRLVVLLVVNNALVVYFMKISSVLFSILCAVSLSHFVLVVLFCVVVYVLCH